MVVVVVGSGGGGGGGGGGSQGSAQNLLRGGKKGQNFLYFCHFSIEKRWLKWLGGGKYRPVWVGSDGTCGGGGSAH